MFSKSCKYAIRAVFYLAAYASEEVKLGVDTLAEKLNVPKHFLAKILQTLVRNHLVSSAKGRRGGFYLSEKNKKSNLLSVIECIEGPGTFTTCILGLSECSNETPCPYHLSVKKYRDKFYDLVASESIEESAKRIKSQNLKLKI